MADIFLIKKHWISEKSVTGAQKQNKYVFQVDPKASKNEIKKVVHELFKVDVESVNMIRVHARTKRFRASTGKIPGYKKAIVTIKKGQAIDLQ